MKVRKIVILALIIAILIVIISGIYYFNTPVKYSYVYEELFTVNKEDTSIIDDKFQNNICYFSSVTEWNNFASMYFENASIPPLKDTKGSIVVILTDLYKDQKSNITEIVSIKRSILFYKITLSERAEINIVSGFQDDEIVKNILVYQIKSHLIGSDFIKDIKVFNK